MVNTFPKPTMPSGHTVAVFLAATAALAVASAAFTRSFSALSALAVMHQWPADQAWILPVALDGMIIVPTVAAVVRRDARWYAWSLLVAGTILSVAGNGIHAWLTAMSHIAVGLAVIPPLVTLAAVHLTIVVARQDHDRTATTADETTTEPADRATNPDPTVTPADPDRPIRDTDRDETPHHVRRLRVAPATPVQPVAAPGETIPVATQQTLRLDVAPVVAAKRPARRSTKHNDTIRAEALQRVAAGETLRDVADRLGVSKDAVWRWKRDATMAATVAAG